MSNEERLETAEEEVNPGPESGEDNTQPRDSFVENEGEPEEVYLDEQRPTAESDGYREKYVRLLADFDNYRKRVSKDLAQERQRGRRDAAEKLLIVYDSLAMGLLTMKDAPEAVRAGMEAVRAQLIAAFSTIGVQKIETKGRRFDPAIHEAIAQMPSDAEEGIILEESRAGFEDAVGLLRAAQVVVSGGNGQ
jgi:molecular chaperone GrpE